MSLAYNTRRIFWSQRLEGGEFGGSPVLIAKYDVVYGRKSSGPQHER
jgi:hypothetical protein